MIYKNSGLEESSMSDPRTELPIHVSTTVRKKYREYYAGQEKGEGHNFSRTNYGTMSNTELNDIIAQDFAASYDKAMHMFLSKGSNLNTKKREWIEIRGVATFRPFNVFFSVIRDNSIDIITVSTIWKKPRAIRRPIKSVRES